MKFFESFRDELKKMADDFLADPSTMESVPDGAQFATPEDLPGPAAMSMPQASGIEVPSAQESVGLREDQKATGDAVGELASSDARRALTGMLDSTDGRRALRETFGLMDRKVQEISTMKEALTRGLLRARRDGFGPDREPVERLNEMLFRDLPPIAGS